MGDDAAAAAALVANRQLMMVGVLPGDEEKAAALLDDIEAVLVRWAKAASGMPATKGVLNKPSMHWPASVALCWGLAACLLLMKELLV
jgi:hypothetical protein